MSKKDLTEGLTQLLGETYHLMMKTHYFHWNVIGPQFFSLHTLFETHYQALFLAADEIAERIRALNEFVQSPFKIPTYPTAPIASNEMLKILIADHENCVKIAESLCSVAQAEGDEATADLLIRRLQAHGDVIWMLKSSIG